MGFWCRVKGCGYSKVAGRDGEELIEIRDTVCVVGMGRDTSVGPNDDTFEVAMGSDGCVFSDQGKAASEGFDVCLVRAGKPEGALCALVDECVGWVRKARIDQRVEVGL